MAFSTMTTSGLKVSITHADKREYREFAKKLGYDTMKKREDS